MIYEKLWQMWAGLGRLGRMHYVEKLCDSNFVLSKLLCNSFMFIEKLQWKCGGSPHTPHI